MFIQAPQTGTGSAVGTGPFIRRSEESQAAEPPAEDDGGASPPAEGPTSIITTRPDEEPTPIILPIIRERVIRSGRDERYEDDVTAAPPAPAPAPTADTADAVTVERPMRPVPSEDEAAAGDLPTVVRDGLAPVPGGGDAVEALIPRRATPPEPAPSPSEAADDTAIGERSVDEPPVEVVPFERAEAPSPVVQSPAPAAALRPVSPELRVGAVQALGEVDAPVAMISDPDVAMALPLPLSWSAALNRAATEPGGPDASAVAPTAPETAAAPAPAAATPALAATAVAAAPASPEAAAVAPQSDPTGTHRVQVVAVQSRTQAESEWQRISRLYPDLLGGAELFIQQIDLGDRGVWYRVQAGAFAQSDANRLCSTIQARGGDCIVRQR